MKLDEIVEGERYEVVVSYASSYRHAAVGQGRYQAEAVKVRVHRRVRRDGWFQSSKNPDGVLVEILIDGESFPDNLIAVSPKDILRSWSEKVAEEQERAERRRKEERWIAVQKLRSNQANGILTDILGKMTDPLDRRTERVSLPLGHASYEKQRAEGTIWMTVDEMVRLAQLAQKGLEHERRCERSEG